MSFIDIDIFVWAYKIEYEVYATSEKKYFISLINLK